MPTYEYVCDACKHEFEKFHSILAAPEKVCPKCRKRKVRRKIGIGAGVLFKGTGFYETDYRSDGYSKAAEADRKSSESPKPADAKSDAKPAASTGGTTETKSAPTESAKPAKEPRVKAIHPSREGRGQGNLRRPAAKKSTGRRRGSVLKRVLIAVAALVVALVVGGMLMIDVIARKGIEVAGTAVLGVDTSVRSVRIGLISDTSSIKDMAPSRYLNDVRAWPACHNCAAKGIFQTHHPHKLTTNTIFKNSPVTYCGMFCRCAK
jgi:putative FmdB family regulatory protein